MIKPTASYLKRSVNNKGLFTNSFRKINMENQKIFNEFIESLNNMSLADGDLYVQYAIMKNASKILSERIDEISDLISEEMDRIGVEKQKFDYGTFSIGIRKKWNYSDEVKNMEVGVKELKKKEEEDGIATFEENKFLSFR